MAKEKPRGLGRGLDALLGAQVVAPGPVNQATVKSELIKEILLSDIEPNPDQPRSHFDDERLSELADSIKRLGIIQPITVSVLGPNKYQIISGERRYRASIKAGLDSIPAYVRKADDNERLLMALVENIQRDDLDAIEVALSYQRLVNEFHLTQEEISDEVGKKRSTVANYLRLLKLPDEIQLAIREQLLSMGHARALINVSDTIQQVNLAKKIIDKGLSVRQVEEMVKAEAKPKVQKNKPQHDDSEELSESFFKLAEGVEKCFDGGVVSIKRGVNGGAKLTIDLKTDEDIRNAIEKLGQLK